MANTETANGSPMLEDENFEEQQSNSDDAIVMNESHHSVQLGSPVHPVNYDLGTNQTSPPMERPNQRTAKPPNTLATKTQWTTSVPPANTTIPLSSPSPTPNGDKPMHVSKPQQSKIDYLRQWSLSTYKCTRQIISERLGKVTKTVDVELETKIEQLRETQSKYLHVLRLARALSSHFYHMVQTQHSLAEAFSDLASKSPELQEEFSYNAETQRNLGKNGEILMGALNFFVSSLNTLCNKTMEDTLLTIKQYETARLEYDAYRNDMEELHQAARTDAISSKADDVRHQFSEHKEKYERLRSDVSVKLQFLDENKVKVMHKQLLLFHNAISSYFSGNQAMLEATLKQFNIKLKNPNSSSPSWLEQ